MGERPGDRRFPGRPQPAGIEIEAHAGYQPGDDLRHLDWSALGRLDVLLVRRYTAEREILFHLLVDTSASMGCPAGDRKLAAAAELAVALAYVALSSNDAVRVALLGETPRLSRIHRQRASIGEIAELVAGAVASGAVVLGPAVEGYVRRHPRPGVAIVVSDLMVEPADVECAVHVLRARRFEVLLLHVLGPHDLEPALDPARNVLRDVESGAIRAVAATPATRARYREALGEHLGALETIAARTASAYARLVTTQPVYDFVTTDLARLGIVTRR